MRILMWFRVLSQAAVREGVELDSSARGLLPLPPCPSASCLSVFFTHFSVCASKVTSTRARWCGPRTSSAPGRGSSG